MKEEPNILYDMITGIINNLLYTTTSIIFIFFLRKYFFKFFNRELSNNKYFIKLTIGYSPFSSPLLKYGGNGIPQILSENKECSDRIEIISISKDIRLRLRRMDCDKDIKIIVIRRDNFQISTYFSIFLLMLKLKITRVLFKDIKIGSEYYEYNPSSNFEEEVRKEINILYNN